MGHEISLPCTQASATGRGAPTYGYTFRFKHEISKFRRLTSDRVTDEADARIGR